MTWTFNVKGYIGVVTGENVFVAREYLKKKFGLDVSNANLIPVVTEVRHARLLSHHWDCETGSWVPNKEQR